MIRLTEMNQDTVNALTGSLLELYPSLYRRVAVERGSYNTLMLANASSNRRTTVIVGGGSGNEPWPLGYAGPGMADGAVAGPYYTAPGARAVLALTREVFHDKGVIYICTNHAGDVLNFELAGELAGLEGIHTSTIAVTDDAASASRDNRAFRKGRGGVLFVVKVCAGAVRAGYSMDEAVRIASKANHNISTLNVYASSVRDIQTGEVLLEIPDGYVNYGGGFNGEPGIFQKPFRGLDDMVDNLMDYLIGDLQPLPSARVAVMINGTARTSSLEMMLIARRVQKRMRENEIKIHKIYMEHCFSSVGTDGFSITMMDMDDELVTCLDEPGWTPFIHDFGENRQKMPGDGAF